MTHTPSTCNRQGILPKEAAKVQAADLIRQQGYRVNLGQPGQNCLWVTNGERVACIEVKLAKFTRNKARHQASVKISQPVNLLMLLLHNQRDHYYPFIFPLSAFGQRYNISIWMENPVNYTGQWAKYLNAWDHLQRVVAQAPARDPWHLSLFR